MQNMRDQGGAAHGNRVRKKKGWAEMMETYRTLIIELVNEQTDELLLKQIYTILIRRKRKAGV